MSSAALVIESGWFSKGRADLPDRASPPSWLGQRAEVVLRTIRNACTAEASGTTLARVSEHPPSEQGLRAQSEVMVSVTGGVSQQQGPAMAVAGGVALEQERDEVTRAQAGDRAALAVLLRRYGPLLYRSVLLPRLGSQVAAEDALSQTYAKIIEKLDRFHWQNVGIYPWMRVVAMRIALDNLRARRREVPFDTEDLAREVDRAEHELGRSETDADTIARQDAEQARLRVEQALDKIHPRYAKAIRMRILEEQSREDVAQELGVTTATFDVVLHRAMAALRKALGSASEDSP